MSKTRYQRAIERLLRFLKKQSKKKHMFDGFEQAAQKLLSYSNQEESK